MASGGEARPIEHEHELVEHFALGGKPPAEWRVGAEHEKIAVYEDGSPVPYEGPRGIRAILERLAQSGGYERVEEVPGQPIALRRGLASITLEPGGQCELSGAIAKDAVEAGRELCDHVRELKRVTADLGISWLAVGFRPFGTLDEVPWMPKGRYRVMRAYLPTRGRLAHEMMKRTATVQANLDYEDEADAARKMRTAMGVTSLVTALYANSPLVDGKPSGFKTYRGAVWLETDPDRCGLLPFVFEPPAEGFFAAYAAWALDVPMFFVYRQGYIPAEGMTFRRYLHEGFQGHRATLDDWVLHLSTLFPEVRLKRYLEVRGADSGPFSLVHALPALWMGLLYDREACDAAWRLVADLTYAEREALRAAVPREGLTGRAGRHATIDLARELVGVARGGLSRIRPEDVALLAPLEQIARESRVPADDVLAAYAETRGDPTRLIPRLRY